MIVYQSGAGLLDTSPGPVRYGYAPACTGQPSGRLSRAIRHDILDFYVRELVTLGAGEVEKKMARGVLVKPRWNHHNIC